MAALQGAVRILLLFSCLISTLSVASERPPVRWQPHISNLKGRTADSDGGTSGITSHQSAQLQAGKEQSAISSAPTPLNPHRGAVLPHQEPAAISAPQIQRAGPNR